MTDSDGEAYTPTGGLADNSMTAKSPAPTSQPMGNNHSVGPQGNKGIAMGKPEPYVKKPPGTIIPQVLSEGGMQLVQGPIQPKVGK